MVHTPAPRLANTVRHRCEPRVWCAHISCCRWERIDDGNTISAKDQVVISKGEMRIPIPYAGVFCAFSHPEKEDIAAVRFHVFAMPELLRDERTALRIHLCPDLPDQTQEMELVEKAVWGTATCLGSSPTMHICQGAKFTLHYLDQVFAAHVRSVQPPWCLIIACSHRPTADVC